MISTVGQNDTMSKVKLSEFPSQKELMEKELEARNIGNPFKMPLLQANCDCVVEKCAVIITNGVVTQNLHFNEAALLCKSCEASLFSIYVASKYPGYV